MRVPENVLKIRRSPSFSRRYTFNQIILLIIDVKSLLFWRR